LRLLARDTLGINYSRTVEPRHDKPVIAVNSATYGITDQIDGHGNLFADH